MRLKQHHCDTIFALATPPGRSGVAVVRVSGPQSWEGLYILSPNLSADSASGIVSHTARLSVLTDPASDTLIDLALVVAFKSPRSYTGEDIVEYQVHGGRAVVDSLLRALSALPGHRMALPGEFTRRAFENGKMDLTEAEAVADLINAETSAQKMLALAQMGGALSELYQGWAGRLKKALAHLEADIEFPDEDMPEGIAPEVKESAAALQGEIAAHLRDNRRGERLRDGIHIAVIGAPNAGKSSLVNALAQREIAIVSDLPGTTRDILEAHLDLGGYPVILSDTAGLRPEQIGAAGHDAIEGEGIRRALKRAQEADIKILLFDATEETPHAATLALRDENSLIIFNKADIPLPSPGSLRSLSLSLQGEGLRERVLDISVKTGAGLDLLIQKLVEKIKASLGKSEAPALTRARHRDAVNEAHAALERALQAPLPELFAEDLRLALRALGRITGKTDVEDLLDVVFRDFCIGK